MLWFLGKVSFRPAFIKVARLGMSTISLEKIQSTVYIKQNPLQLSASSIEDEYRI